MIAGAAGWVAGAMSMAAGEHAAFAAIYAARGLHPETVNDVATQLMTKSALRAHAQDELAITLLTTAKPI
jgi:vacuolar iron transporter family protein